MVPSLDEVRRLADGIPSGNIREHWGTGEWPRLTEPLRWVGDIGKDREK
jgi:hypothetical protein